MHLYQNTGRTLHDWNAVDVEMDGRLQHGYVVGLEEHENAAPRLLVNFGCPTQEAVPVAHGKSWDSYRIRWCKARKNEAVEVLLHDGPQRPWSWYPGKMLIPVFDDMDEMALVDVVVDGQSRRELLPKLQIRNACEAAVRPGLLAADHFVVETCSLPNGYWALQASVSTVLLKEVESRYQLRVITVLSQTMRYLRRRQERPFTEEVMAKFFEEERANHDFHRKIAALKKREERKRKKPLSGGEGGLALPLEVLKEVFHSLDTVDRVRCQRTCKMWADLLTAPDMCRDVRVARPQYRFWINYVLYACLAKHVTPATRTVSLHDAVYGDEVFHVLSHLLRSVGMPRLHRFIVDRRSFRLGENGLAQYKLGALSSEITAGLIDSKLAASCDRLILKDFALTVVKKRSSEALFQCRIPLVVFTGGQVDEAKNLDLLEEHLRCEGPPLDMQRIAYCLAELIDTEEKVRQVNKIVRGYQASDPRPSAHYRGRRWSLYNMASVDVGKLNKFCLAVLMHCVQDWNHGDQPGHAEQPSEYESEEEEEEDDDGDQDDDDDEEEE